MQELNPQYSASLSQRVRCPVLVVELHLRNDAGVIYVPSQTVSGSPDSTWTHSGRIAAGGVSASSQRIDVDTGAASVGSGSLTLVDKDATLSRAFAAAKASGTDIRHAVARVKQGFSNLVYADFEPLWAMIVVDVTYQNGGYKIQLRDPTRFARKTIMTPQTGVVFSIIADGTPTRFGFGCDSARYSADDIDIALWRHQVDSVAFPNQWKKLIRVGDEIIGYSAFRPVVGAGGQLQRYGAWEYVGTIPQRAALGSLQENHSITGSPDGCEDFPKWEEVPYVDARPADLITFLFTGLPVDGSGPELPQHWHAGMDREWLDLDSFAVLQDILPENFRLQKPPGETDALSWVQKNVLGPLGWQLITAADGRLTLRQAGTTNPDSAYLHELGRCDISTGTSITQRNSKLVTRLTVAHGYVPGIDTYTQFDHQLNPWSEELYGDPDSEERNLQLESLIPGAAATAIVTRLLGRHAQWWAQPQTIVKTVVKGSLHAMEVTDTVRLTVVNEQCPSPLRDYAMGTADEVDRTFEIQSWQHNPINNTIALSLVGGGIPIAVRPPGNSVTVPDSALIGNGDPWPLAAVLRAGESTIAPGTYWYDGDITIPAASTLKLSSPGSLRIFCTGELTIFGTIDISGMGARPGSGGYIGTTRATGGVDRTSVYRCQDHDHQDYTAFTTNEYQSRYGANRHGVVSSLSGFTPIFENGVLGGLPHTLAGSGGAPGGDYRFRRTGGCTEADTNFFVQDTGSLGGAGGGGLVTVCPNLALGPNAKVILDGEDGEIPTSPLAGAGAGGTPGGWLHVATSPASTPPIGNYAQAIRGGTQDTSDRLPSGLYTNRNRVTKHSYYEGYSAADLVADHVRVVYVS